MCTFVFVCVRREVIIASANGYEKFESKFTIDCKIYLLRVTSTYYILNSGWISHVFVGLQVIQPR